MPRELIAKEINSNNITIHGAISEDILNDRSTVIPMVLGNFPFVSR